MPRDRARAGNRLVALTPRCRIATTAPGSRRPGRRCRPSRGVSTIGKCRPVTTMTASPAARARSSRAACASAARRLPDQRRSRSRRGRRPRGKRGRNISRAWNDVSATWRSPHPRVPHSLHAAAAFVSRPAAAIRLTTRRGRADGPRGAGVVEGMTAPQPAEQRLLAAAGRFAAPPPPPPSPSSVAPRAYGLERRRCLLAPAAAGDDDQHRGRGRA